MAITTYAQLKAAVITWSHREDLDLLIDDFIDLTESEMLTNPTTPLSVRGEESLQTASMSTSSRFLELPSRYKKIRRAQLIVNSQRVDLVYRTPEQLRVYDGTGTPHFFTVTTQFEFDITPDQAYTIELQCLVDLAALSSSNTTNAVLTASPNVYLYGCLWAAANYGNDTEMAASYYSQFLSAIDGLNNKDRLGRYGPAPVMRIEGCTP